MLNKYAKSWKQAKKMKPFHAKINDLISILDREMELTRDFINKLK